MSKNYKKVCCNPFLYHKKVINKNLRILTEEFKLKIENQNNLDPDINFICTNCHVKLKAYKPASMQFIKSPSVSASSSSSSDMQCNPRDPDHDTMYVDIDETNTTLEALNVSPLKMHSVPGHSKAKSVKSKYYRAKSVLKSKLEQTLNETIHEESISNEEAYKAKKFDEIMVWLKEKYNSAISIEEKIRILTLSPLTVQETMTYFNCTKYLVDKSRKYRNTYGILPDIPHCSKGKCLTSLVCEEVKNFYLDDDISRVMPGKANCISIRSADGNRILEPKRLVLGNLKEIYTTYKERGYTQIGFSTFAKLRPKQCIIAGSSGTHSVCVCTHHQNPTLMVGAIGKQDLNVTYLIKMAVCSSDSFRCMLGQCRDCPGKEKILNYLLSLDEVQGRDSITYSKWTSTDRSNLECHISSIEEFSELLSDLIVKLTKHHYVAKAQSTYLKSLKEKINHGEVIIIGDFSENYTFVVQDATQGFHWVNEQSTLHPFVLYYKNDARELKHQSYCFISDDLTHNTAVVYCFQETLMNELKVTMNDITKIYYFSDGCAGQYKNCKNFSNITYHEKDFGIKAEWNFFATSHGKNACDGIGAVVKRAAYKASLQRTMTNHIVTPKSLFEYANKEIKGIKFFFTSKETILQTTNKLKGRFSVAKTIKGTQSFHKIIPVGENMIKAYSTSDASNYTTCKVSQVSVHDDHILQTGQYIACNYEETLWLGMITEYSEENNDYKISFLNEDSKIRSYFFFPEEEDICWVKADNILGHLSTPTIVPGVKIVYKFLQKEINAAERKLKH